MFKRQKCLASKIQSAERLNYNNVFVRTLSRTVQGSVDNIFFFLGGGCCCCFLLLF